MRSPLPALIARPYPLLLAAVGIALASAAPASAQQLAGWAGSIRCELQAQAPGYSHQETQTWTLTGAAPTVQGSVTAYPATWTVVGAGQHDRITGTSTRRVAQWTANVAGVTAPLGLTLHAPLGRTFDVSKWHAQLTRGGGYTGTDQFINGGVPASSQPLVATVYEWQFPKIDAAITETQLSGTNTTQVKAFIGPLQPFEAVPTVTCAWSLAKGSAPPSLPPSTLPPAGSASGGATPPGTGTTAGGTAPGSTPPGGTPAGTTPGGAVPGGGGTAGRPTVEGPTVATGATPGDVLSKTPPTSDLWTVANGVRGPFIKGQPAVLGGRMRNLGPVSVTGAILTVTMPPSGFSITQMACFGLQNGPPVPCPTIAQLANGFATPTIAPGRQFSVDITGTVTGDVGSSLSFAMTGRAPAGVYDPDSTNNADGDTVVIGGP